MALNLNRLRGDDASAVAAALGWDTINETSVFVGPGDAQELIVDPANTPWTLDVSSNLLRGSVTMDAGAEAVTLFHDIVLPTSAGDETGWKLVGFDVYYTVTTADLTAADFSVAKTTLPAATGSAPTAAAVAVTGTELLTQADHVVAMTVTTPPILEENEALRLTLSFTMANTGVLRYYGTRLRFEIDG